MSARFTIRCLLLAAVLGLVACAPTSQNMRLLSPAANSKRAESLGASTAWSFAGRIAVSDGKDGGSGRIQWRQDGPWYEINVRAPVAGGSWRLSGTQGLAQLDGARPETLRDVDGEVLLARELGWNLPLSKVVFWVRGLPASQANARVTGDRSDLPREIAEDGWRVEFRSWVESTGGLSMPQRIVARKPPFELRLTVDSWNLDASK